MVGSRAARRGPLGHAGAHHQDRPAGGRQRGRHLRRLGARRRREVDRLRRHAGRDGADRPRLPVAPPEPGPAQVPDPGDGLPDRVPDRPDRLHGQRRLHELLDGALDFEVRGDHVDPEDDAAATGGREDLRDDPGPPGRRHRDGAARRGRRPVVRRQRRRARAARGERRHRGGGLRHRGGRPRGAHRSGPARLRRRADGADRADRGGESDSGRGPRRRARAGADAPLRPGQRHLRPHLRRRRFPRRGRGRVRLCAGDRARARLEDLRRARRTSTASSASR